jgi:hypothetical protein
MIKGKNRTDNRRGTESFNASRASASDRKHDEELS